MSQINEIKVWSDEEILSFVEGVQSREMMGKIITILTKKLLKPEPKKEKSVSEKKPSQWLLWVEHVRKHVKSYGWTSYTVTSGGVNVEYAGSVKHPQPDGTNMRVYADTLKPFNGTHGTSLAKQFYDKKTGTGSHPEIWIEFCKLHAIEDEEKEEVQELRTISAAEAEAIKLANKKIPKEKVAKEKVVKEKVVKPKKPVVLAMDTPAPVKASAVSVSQEVKKPVKKALKTKSDWIRPAEGEVNPFTLNGVEYNRGFKNAIYDADGDYQGVYNEDTGVIDDSLANPEED
jgi:hypothetical protein